MSSSIHTIHRPLARSLRIPIPNSKLQPLGTMEEEHIDDTPGSEEDLENDFEETPRMPTVVPKQLQPKGNAVLNTTDLASPFDGMRERAPSMATIRIHRRTRLAEKLKEVYELDDIKEVWAGA